MACPPGIAARKLTRGGMTPPGMTLGTHLRPIPPVPLGTASAWPSISGPSSSAWLCLCLWLSFVMSSDHTIAFLRMAAHQIRVMLRREPSQWSEQDVTAAAKARSRAASRRWSLTDILSVSIKVNPSCSVISNRAGNGKA